MQTSNVEWTDVSWNPVRGCSRVSEGCRNCYAEKQAERIVRMNRARGVPERVDDYSHLLARGGQWNGQIVVLERALRQPLRRLQPSRTFVNSMSDLFHEQVPMAFIDRVFAVMAACPQHTFQVLTKRPERMRLYLNSHGRAGMIMNAARKLGLDPSESAGFAQFQRYGFLPNVWLGVSAENQSTANHRIWQLQLVPAAVRWLSAEPLLDEINFADPSNSHNLLTGKCLHPNDYTQDRPGLDWVVVGGESGPGARPMDPDWASGIGDQCVAAKVPFFFKQWGEWCPWDFDSWNPGALPPERVHQFPKSTVYRVGKKVAGRTLNGRTWAEFPA